LGKFMQDPNCVFCKLINKQLPTKIIKETETVLAVEDIAPKAPIHYLIIPKEHIINIKYLEDKQAPLVWEMIKMAKSLAADLGESSDFNLISNNGKQAGQCVFHMHWHFISGKNIVGF